MSEDKLPTPFGDTELEQEPSNIKLQDLEQHISNRINQLSDTGNNLADASGEAQPLLDMLDEVPVADGLAPEFETFESFEAFSFESLSGNQDRFRSTFQEVRSSYQGTEDLIKGINDLSDLVTDSVRQLNIRLNALEERFADLSSANTADLPKNIKEIRAILVKLYQRGIAASELDSERNDTTKVQSDLIFEINQQFRELDGRLERIVSEVKQKSEERNLELKGELTNKVKELEKFLREIRDYLNRHVINLAVLLILILFIAGILITNSLDRMATFVTHSMDELRTQFDQLTLPPLNPRQPPFLK